MNHFYSPGRQQSSGWKVPAEIAEGSGRSLLGESTAGSVRGAVHGWRGDMRRCCFSKIWGIYPNALFVKLLLKIYVDSLTLLFYFVTEGRQALRVEQKVRGHGDEIENQGHAETCVEYTG